MKEYACVEVDNYTKVAEKIQEFLMNGWHLHTYQTAGDPAMGRVIHHLLFERD